MKKLFLVFILVVLIVGAFLLKKERTNRKRNITTIYKLGNKTYTLLVADTPERWEKGLMFYRKLEGVDGMIFIFPDKQYRTFWNKNTYLDLDLIWLDDDRIIGKSFLPSVEKSEGMVTVSSPNKTNKVIELVKK